MNEEVLQIQKELQELKDLFFLHTHNGIDKSRTITSGGSYKEIAKTILTSADTTISLGTFISTTHLRLIVRGAQTSSPVITMRFNGDSGSNYDYQNSTNTGTSVAIVRGLAQTSIDILGGASALYDFYAVIDIYNTDTDYKVGTIQFYTADVSSTLTKNGITGFNWKSNSLITSISILGTVNFGGRSSLTVLGHN